MIPRFPPTINLKVVQIVGEEKTITGQYVGTTSDSPETVVDEFLGEVVGSEQVERPGFLADEQEPTITVRTAEGAGHDPYRPRSRSQRRLTCRWAVT